jgi:hypothetical protein
MSVRVRPGGTGFDRPLLAVVLVALVITAAGALWLASSAVGGRPSYRTVQIDNQAGLPLQVDAAGPDGGRLGLGLANPHSVTTFHEVVDLGRTWTFVVSYGGQEVWRQGVDARELAGRGWTVRVPDDVTLDLERQGYR